MKLSSDGMGGCMATVADGRTELSDPPQHEAAKGGPLPEHYSRWVAAALGGDLPVEHRASCASCSMSNRVENDSRELFDAAVKCCTFVPDLANFIVGSIIRDDDAEFAEGRRTVEMRLDYNCATTPLGLLTPKPVSHMYRDIVRPHKLFGRSRDFVCPHYIAEGGRCGIWKYRESVCSTWYCKFTKGSRGRDFWLRGLQPFLQAIDSVVAVHCVQV